jgi:hypothetical protein
MRKANDELIALVANIGSACYVGECDYGTD